MWRPDENRGRFAGNFLFMTSLRLEPSFVVGFKIHTAMQMAGCGSDWDPLTQLGPLAPVSSRTQAIFLERPKDSQQKVLRIMQTPRPHRPSHSYDTPPSEVTFLTSPSSSVAQGCHRCCPRRCPAPPGYTHLESL